MYIYIPAQNLISKVVGISADPSVIQLDKAFPAALSTTPIYVVKQMGYKSVRAISTGTAAAILQGVTFKPGEIADFESAGGVEAIAYNANGASAEITFELSE